MMDRPYVHVACFRRPRPNFFALSPPSERLKQANVHANFLQVWNVMRLHHLSNRGGRGLGGGDMWHFRLTFY